MSGFTRAKSVERFVENYLKTGMINSNCEEKHFTSGLHESSNASFSRFKKIVSRLLKPITAVATVDTQMPQR